MFLYESNIEVNFNTIMINDSVLNNLSGDWKIYKSQIDRCSSVLSNTRAVVLSRNQIKNKQLPFSNELLISCVTTDTSMLNTPLFV